MASSQAESSGISSHCGMLCSATLAILICSATPAVPMCSVAQVDMNPAMDPADASPVTVANMFLATATIQRKYEPMQSTLQARQTLLMWP